MEADKQLIRYNSNDGKAEIDVNLANKTVWLSLNDLDVLFERDKSMISRHIGNLYKGGELRREATVANFATVLQEGSREIRRDIEYFNLDVIISVGYRVKSKRGTNFRMWATQVLKRQSLERERKTAHSENLEDNLCYWLKILCDGHVIKRHYPEIKRLIYNAFLCDDHVIGRQKILFDNLEPL